MSNSQQIQDNIANRAIMFADVSGSSALYKLHGNVEAKAQIDRTIALMSELTEKYQGYVVKTIGDEIMARFDSPAQACQTAIAIQQQCRKDALCSSNDYELAIRIGMDFGHTLLDGDDVFGDTVNDAAYVTQIARANQIVVTQAFVDGLPSKLRGGCQEFDRVAIKGETSKTLIYRLHWEQPADDQHNATMVMKLNHITQKFSTKQLQLDYNGQRIAVTPDNVPFIIGRDHRKVRLHIDSSLASRDHCHIVLRRGKFVLVDHSTNGTYVRSAEQAEIYLRREELPLMGEGTISIGKRAGEAAGLTIDYWL